MTDKKELIPEKVRHFTIFVDANIISTDEDQLVFFPLKFIEWWKALVAEENIELKIPSIVYSEIHQQKTTPLRKKYTSSSRDIKIITEALTTKKLILPNELSKKDIKEAVDKILWAKLKEMPNCTIEQVPYNKITGDKLKTIIDNAIWRIPPFKDNKEGHGFRDSIILETIYEYCLTNLNTQVIFLTNDNRVKEALNKNSLPNLQRFDDLDPALEYMRAIRTKYKPEEIDNIIRRAVEIISDRTEAGFRKSITDYLTDKYLLVEGKRAYEYTGASLFAFRQSSPRVYTCNGNPSFYFLDNIFLSVIGENLFRWKATYGVQCSYNYEGLSSLLFPQNENIKRMRQIIIEVEWQVNVNDNDQFDNFQIIGHHQLVDNYKDEKQSDDSNNE